jgi:hypothetical protein
MLNELFERVNIGIWSTRREDSDSQHTRTLKGKERQNSFLAQRVII